MSFTSLAGLGGIGFVVLAIIINVIYIRSGLPLPGSDQRPKAYVDLVEAMKKPSIFAPATWLFTTLFAAGLSSTLWLYGQEGWALMGFAGVIMQNATFMCVEALRFGLASVVTRDHNSTAGLWGFINVLFGFNQLFLAIALLGFTVAGANAGIMPGWHVWLGYVSALLLFLSSSAAPYNVNGTNRFSLVGLIGWLGWVTWIVVYSIILLNL